MRAERAGRRQGRIGLAADEQVEQIAVLQFEPLQVGASCLRIGQQRALLLDLEPGPLAFLEQASGDAQRLLAAADRDGRQRYALGELPIASTLPLSTNPATPRRCAT